MAAISIAQGLNFKASGEAIRQMIPLLTGRHLASQPARAGFDGFASSEPDFAPHYEQYIRPRLETFEARRLAALQTHRQRLFVFCPASLAMIVGTIVLMPILMSWTDEALKFLILPILGVFLLWAWAISPIRKYHSGVKEEIYPLVFKYFGDDFEYRERGPLEIKALKPSDIIPNYDRAHTEDYVKGSHRDVTLELTEAKLTKRRGSGKHRRTVTVFQGLFVLFSAHKTFSGKTVVKKDAGAVANWFEDKFNRLDTVRLEDPTFEKRFEVYSTDQVEARYLLTPSFMERLMALSELFDKAHVQCSFYDDHLLLMIPSRKDRFDAISAFQPVTFQREITTILKEMALIFEIVEVLKLDERTGL